MKEGGLKKLTSVQWKIHDASCLESGDSARVQSLALPVTSWDLLAKPIAFLASVALPVKSGLRYLQKVKKRGDT